MDTTAGEAMVTAATRRVSRNTSNSPELQRVLANIRVLVAIVAATEAVSLSAATRSPMMFAVVGYAAWAGWLCWVELQGQHTLRSPLTSWIDAVWILLFSWLAGTQSSLFTLLLLFPVLFAALSFGFVPGLLISLFAAAGAGADLLSRDAHFGKLSPELILQPLSILVLGPLVAGLARAGVRMNEQVTIADRLLAEADPRLGVKRVAETLLGALCRHFSADLGLLLIWLPGGEPRVLRSDGHGKFVELGGELRTALVEALVRIPQDVVAVHHSTFLVGRIPLRYTGGFDLATKAPTTAAKGPAQELAEALDAHSMVVVPICRRGPHPCRLVLDSARRRYRSHDGDLLAGILDQVSPVIENAGLLERLADELMATERARIGRDLHDNAVQPYLGLKYGIEALARKAAPDNPLRPDILSLQEVALTELHQLRELVSGMRDGAGAHEDALCPALHRQAKRFTELFGIDVTVQCEPGLQIRRKLAAAIFPMVSEALTNVRRHTPARRAEIFVRGQPHIFVIEIRNPHDIKKPPAPFVPRAVTERAQSVSGCVVVDIREDGITALMISIPKSA